MLDHILRYPYLWLNIGTLLGPLLLSFDKKVAFYRHWKNLLLPVVITAAVFIIWDAIFTARGVWGFNDDYLLGIYFLKMPLEEWLFFFTIPYASVFIYACLNAYISRDILKPYAGWITYAILMLCVLSMVFFWEKDYTRWTAIGLGAYVAVIWFGFRPAWMGRFYLAWAVVLIPFSVVNGVLTSLPVVWYNNAENLDISRLGTIPMEDPFYNMLLLLMNISLFQWFQKYDKRFAPSIHKSYVQP